MCLGTKLVLYIVENLYISVMNDYTKGQKDLINHIKTSVVEFANDKEIDLAHAIIEMLKQLKPLEPNS